MANIDFEYRDLVNEILKKGIHKEDRTGTGTISIFGKTIEHDFKNFDPHHQQEDFPLLTFKKMPWDKIVSELLWFLNGETNIKWLLDRNNHIWVGDAFKYYRNAGVFSSNPVTYKNNDLRQGLIDNKEDFIDKIKNNEEFAEIWGDMGPIYGKQWRDWGHITRPITYNEDGSTIEKTVDPVDQITDLIKNLKENPDSRRLMVNAWNVSQLSQMKLPPCHYGFQVWTRLLSESEKETYVSKQEEVNGSYVPERAISLMWNQRSVDTGLGLPFNIASYALLLKIIGKEVNMVPEKLIGSLGDTHIYKDHQQKLEDATKNRKMSRWPPKVKINKNKSLYEYDVEDIELLNYESEDGLKLPLSN